LRSAHGITLYELAVQAASSKSVLHLTRDETEYHRQLASAHKEIDMTYYLPELRMPSVRPPPPAALKRSDQASHPSLDVAHVAMTVVAPSLFRCATAVQASSWATMSAQQRQAFDPTSTSLTGMWVACILSLACVLAAEYATG